MLRLEVDDLRTNIVGTFPYKAVYEATSFLPDGYFFNPYYRKGQSDGRKRFLKAARGQKPANFPTGLLSRVIECLKEKGWAYEIDDRRKDYFFQPDYTLSDKDGGTIDMSEYPYDYQGGAIDEVSIYGRGVIRVGTGGGKTAISAGLIKSANRRSVVLINRRLLAHQIRRELSERLGHKVGFVGDSIYEPEEIVVCMTQTLAAMLKKKDDRFNFLKTFGVVIGDEVHHLESNQWYNIFDSIPASIRVGLSATPTTGGHGMYLEAQTGPVLVDVSGQELIERGINVQPRFWFATIDGPKFPSKTDWRTVFDQGIIDNRKRNDLICHISKVLIKEKKPPLILSSRLKQVDYICDSLIADGVSVGKITGSTSHADRRVYLDGLSTGATECVVGMVSVLGEGIDVGDIRSLINATGSKGGSGTDSESGRQVIQTVGRGLRKSKASDYLPEKTEFVYVDFIDLAHKSLRNASLARLNAIESEGYKNDIGRWADYSPSIA